MRNFIFILASFILSCSNPKTETVKSEPSNTVDMICDMSGHKLLNEIHNEKNDIYCFLLAKDSVYNRKYLTEEAKAINGLLWKEGKEVYLRFYDHADVKNLFGVYPLESKDYIFMAEHYVGEFTTYTDGKDDSLAYMYPFINKEYKEFGGKNFDKFEKLKN